MLAEELSDLADEARDAWEVLCKAQDYNRQQKCLLEQIHKLDFEFYQARVMSRPQILISNSLCYAHTAGLRLLL